MNRRDLCFVLCAMSYVLLSSAMVLVDSYVITNVESNEILENTEKIICNEIKDLVLMVNVSYEVCDTHFIEETGDGFNCLFYATEPLGRYYITAYNHKETGSKLTASGKTVHEGTISTCAADPKYHKFGEYLEIDGRLYVVEDTGSAVKKKHIDLYFEDYKAMARYGSNYQNIYKVTFPFGKPNQN